MSPQSQHSRTLPTHHFISFSHSVKPAQYSRFTDDSPRTQRPVRHQSPHVSLAYGVHAQHRDPGVAPGGSYLLSRPGFPLAKGSPVPTLVWASLRTSAGFWRRQDTISWTDTVGQPTSSAKAAACCSALSWLMTAAGDSAEPPWKRKQTQDRESRSPSPCSAQRPRGTLDCAPSSTRGSPRTLPEDAHRHLGRQA